MIEKIRVTAVPEVRASAICSHALIGRVEQIIPGGRRLQIVLLEELRVGHEDQRIVGDRRPKPWGP